MQAANMYTRLKKKKEKEEVVVTVTVVALSSSGLTKTRTYQTSFTSIHLKTTKYDHRPSRALTVLWERWLSEPPAQPSLSA